MIEHESAFVKQILIYYQNSDYQSACNLGKEFIAKFPSSLMAHYLLAKSCFRCGDAVSAVTEAYRAFNLAESEDDRVATCLLLSCIFYEQKKFSKAYEVLKSLKGISDERLEKANFILSMCLNLPNEALLHVEELYRINKDVADGFVDSFLRGC